MPRADLILYGGAIHTVNPNKPRAEAVAVSGQNIIAVGDESDIMKLAGESTRVIHLDGRACYPGFIDSHAHILNKGLFLKNLNLLGTKSFDEVIDRAREYVKNVPKGRWVLGASWDEGDWGDRKFPNHKVLSDAIPDHPLALRRVCGHMMLVNAKAMEIAGVTKDTQAPSGGQILRDARGELTGLFTEEAMDLVADQIPNKGPEELREILSLGMKAAAEAGLVGVHEMGISADAIDVYIDMADKGEVPIRAYLFIMATSAHSWAERGKSADRLQEWFERGPMIAHQDRVTVRSVKFFSDGSLGARGAALLGDYADAPGERGVYTTNKDDLVELARRCVKHGFQMGTHAIGDAANRLVLDSYEKAFEGVPNSKDLRFRIEHAQTLSAEDVPRFAKLGVIPVMQGCHAVMDKDIVGPRLGSERARYAYCFRKLIDSGAIIPNGSDFPVTTEDPVYGFHCSVNRQNREFKPERGWMPEEAMTRDEALRSFTIDAAYVGFEENKRGSIEPGKWADFTILADDVMQVDARRILDCTQEMTIVGGEVVFEKK